jgi:GNAT superfamily N-acetyltransferase
VGKDLAGRSTSNQETERPTGYPADLERRVRLNDGRVVSVRPVLPSDIDGLRAAIATADERTLTDRFLGWHPSLSESDLHHLTEVDYRWRLALVAFDEEGGGVAIARYEGKPDEDVAEVAIAVDPDWRRVGLGSWLLTTLAEAAVDQGLRRFTAMYQADNSVVEGIVRASGLPRSCRISYGVAETEVDLTPLAEKRLTGASVPRREG